MFKILKSQMVWKLILCDEVSIIVYDIFVQLQSMVNSL